MTRFSSKRAHEHSGHQLRQLLAQIPVIDTINGTDSPVKALVVPTNEELMIARETEQLIRKETP